MDWQASHEQTDIRRIARRKHDAPAAIWALSAWCNAVCGELGEAANLIKKIERGDFTLDERRADLAREFADIVTYLDILAMRAGVDLGEATVLKFNEVSKRVGSTVRIAAMPGGALLAGHVTTPLPHEYWPDYMAMGDCVTCGNTREVCEQINAALAAAEGD